MIIAGRRGGQAVKTLVKILEVGCRRALALYTGLSDGCMLAQAQASASVVTLPCKSTMLC